MSILGNVVLLYMSSFCALVREFSVARFATKHSSYFAVLMIIGSLGYVSGFLRIGSVLEGTVSSR